MPTYKITEKSTGERVGGTIIADNPFSAYAQETGLGDESFLDYTIDQISPNPEPRVFTVLRLDHEGRLWEVAASGDRGRALAEMERHGGAAKGFSLIDEGVDVNRIESRKRRS